MSLIKLQEFRDPRRYGTQVRSRRSNSRNIPEIAHSEDEETPERRKQTSILEVASGKPRTAWNDGRLWKTDLTRRDLLVSVYMLHI